MTETTAVIFDMDGLMFDTERLGLNAYNYVNEIMNINISPQIVLDLIGVSWKTAKKILFEKIGEFDFDKMFNIWTEHIKNHIEINGVPIKKGLYELLDFLEKNKIKKAVATSSHRADTKYLLNKAGIIAYFDEIVTGEMISRGKPEPDIFLYAADLLNADPKKCVVLEDSVSGIKAAYSAGMIPVMVPDIILPDDEIQKLLFAQADSLLDVIQILTEIIF